MKVIKPTTITESMIVSNNLVETYPAWSSATTYAENAIVSTATGIYQSLENSNLNNVPGSSVSWAYLYPSNRWAIFDTQVSSSSESATGNITITLQTGDMDSLALLNLVAETISVTVRDGPAGSVIYSQEYDLYGVSLGDWYQYFFFDVGVQKTQALFTDIPVGYSNTYTTVEISATTGTVSAGILTFGKLNAVGDTEYGATAGITDYSKKETDEFGLTSFVERAFSKRLNARVIIENFNLNKTQRLLYSLRATPAMWVASDDPTFEESLTVFGFYKDFSTDISYPNYSYCSLDIEGLI